MNSEEFRNAIKLKKPRYANSRSAVIKAFANKGSSKSEYSQFGPIYELYIFALILGLKKKLKLPLPPRNLTSEFVEIGKWKRDSALVDFLLMIIFSYSEEIGFDWNELEDMEEKELTETINKIIEFIESYANGGLEYLENEWKDDHLINSPYLFIDILSEATTFRGENFILEGLKPIEATGDIAEDTKRLIQKGESSTLEFKSTLRVNLHTNSPDSRMIHTAMKTIAGFLNSRDGILIIGVSDEKEILGLENDYNTFKEEDKLDAFQKFLDNQIESFLGNSIYSCLKLYFPKIDGKTVCRLDVSFRKSSPTYLKDTSKTQPDLYIRRAASTKALQVNEIAEYVASTWR